MYEYEEIINRISNARRFGKLPGVEVTRVMLAKLGHPQSGMPFVHVAGTNGKGSTCAFLTSILMEAGLKVGTFTSPHLVDFEERITINRRQIPKEDVVRIGNRLLTMDFGVEATMFDYCLLMALLYFKEQKCDLVILETGLGGRLDSTNAIGVPEVAVITKIGFDHTAILGDTLSAIASEKAGILKEGSAAVFERQEAQAREVLVCQAQKAKVTQVKEVTEQEIQWISKLKLRMLGAYQWENAAAAALAARVLFQKSPVLWDKNLLEGKEMEKVIIQGLQKATWKGRLEILSEQPFLLVDGAHNGHGVAALKESLMQLYPGEKFHFIMGVMADKDYNSMIHQMLPLAIDFCAVNVESDRALSAEKLAAYIKKNGVAAWAEAQMDDIFQKVLAGKYKNEKTVAFGSLYFIGDVIKMIEMEKNN